MFLIYYRYVSSRPDDVYSKQVLVRFITFVAVEWAITRIGFDVWCIYILVSEHQYMSPTSINLWAVLISVQAITLIYTQKSIMDIRVACIRKLNKLTTKTSTVPENGEKMNTNESDKERQRPSLLDRRRELVSTRRGFDQDITNGYESDNNTNIVENSSDDRSDGDSSDGDNSGDSSNDNSSEETTTTNNNTSTTMASV